MMKKLLILLVCLLTWSPVLLTAQHNPEFAIKELRHRLNRSAIRSERDSTFIMDNIRLANAYLSRNMEEGISIDSAAILLEYSLQLSKQHNDQKLLNESLMGLCEVMYRNGDSKGSENCVLRVVGNYRANGDQIMEARTWYRMGRLLWRFNTSDHTVYPEILRYYTNALTIMGQLGPEATLEATHVKVSIADLHMCQGKLNQAYEELLENLKVYNELNYIKTHHLYYLLAVTSRLRGELDTALGYAIKCVDNSELTKETYQLSHYLATVGDIYRELNDPNEGLKWYNRALYEWEYNYSMGRNSAVQYRYLHYLCKDLVRIGQVGDALNRTLEFEQKYPPEKTEQKALFTGTKAIVYNALGQHDIAEENFMLSIRYLEEMGAAAWPIYISEVNQELGNFYFARGVYNTAKTHLNTALGFPKGITSMSKRREIYLYLFKADSAMGNYISAIENFQKFKLTNDSIFNENKSKQINELQIQYETTKKESEIVSLQKEKVIQTSKLQQTNNTKNFIFGISALFLIIILLLLYSYSAKQKSNRLLISQKNEIHLKNVSLQNLLEDKEWLLREVHHRVKNNLQIVMSLLNTQSNFLQNEEAYRAIRNSQHRLYAISLIHQKLYKTENMDVISMESYIEDLVSYLKESIDHKGRITIKKYVDPIKMDTARAVPIGLILNEAITNAIKYGFPNGEEGTINVSLKSRKKGYYLLIVDDNGTGFPADFDPNQASTLGLSLIKGLCKQLHADVSIVSKRGVTIKIYFNEMQQPADVLKRFTNSEINA